MKNRNIPFGYRFEDGKIVVNPDEQNTLQRICSEYLDGRSLLQIANGLESDKVEFAPGIITWNKARIMRIVDDDRYLGNATYPQVIDEATLERLRSRKASRNTQTSTDRQSGIYLLKVPIICPSCGNSMHRLQDTRCKCTQKWVCNQCHIQIKKEDTELMEDITTLLNALIQRPEIIRTAQPSQAEPSIEQRRLDNEIARTLEGYDFDKDALREKLYQRASLGYLQIGDEAYVEHKLKNTLEQHDTLDSFDSELTNKTVKLIKLAENGSVSIILINDQEIRKEQTDHANSNPSDATYGKKYCHYSPSIEESVLQEAIMKAVMQTAKQNAEVLKTLKLHIGMGLSAGTTEDNSLDLQIRIAEIEAEFQKMLKAIAADNVEAFDEEKAKALMDEKAKLQIQLDRIADTKQKRENAKSRLDEIFTIIEALANHPISYDDQIVRQILESVIVESKEKIKVVFVGGLEVTQTI